MSAATPVTTTSTAYAFSPNIIGYKAGEAVPEALILRASTVVSTSLEGDAPTARVAWVDDAAAQFSAEGTVMEEAEPGMSEVVVPTAKITQLIRISREQWNLEQTAGMLSTSTMRAITKKANEAFMAQPTPPSESYLPLIGIANVAGIVEGGEITTSLDPLADAVAQIENNGGNPSIIVANPLAWGQLRKLKTATNANTSLLGAGTEDQGKKLLGIEVATSPAVPEGKLLVIDPDAIASAVGPLEIAQSEHQYFNSDSVALRATWRIGWAVQRANRIATVSVAAAA